MVLDEFIHGATAIPSLTFDQITNDYSSKQMDESEEKPVSCKMSQGPACLPLEKYHFHSKMLYKDGGKSG